MPFCSIHVCSINGFEDFIKSTFNHWSDQQQNKWIYLITWLRHASQWYEFCIQTFHELSEDSQITFIQVCINLLHFAISGVVSGVLAAPKTSPPPSFTQNCLDCICQVCRVIETRCSLIGISRMQKGLLANEHVHHETYVLIDRLLDCPIDWLTTLAYIIADWRMYGLWRPVLLGCVLWQLWTFCH